jgi:hypothetical protein
MVSCGSDSKMAILGQIQDTEEQVEWNISSRSTFEEPRDLQTSGSRRLAGDITIYTIPGRTHCRLNRDQDLNLKLAGLEDSRRRQCAGALLNYETADPDRLEICDIYLIAKRTSNFIFDICCDVTIFYL